jgi:uncharacterized protein (TIGR03067 family)
MRQFAMFALFGAALALTVGCKKKAEPEVPTPTPAPNTGPVPGSAEAATDDLKTVQGEWQLVSYQNPDPMEYSNEDLERLKTVGFKIEGDLLKVTAPGRTETFLIRVAQDKAPKAFDLVPADANGKPLVHKFVDYGGPKEREAPANKGIYVLSGDRLTVAVSNRTEYRPAEFKAAKVENTGPLVTVNKRGSSLVLVAELKRVKK